MIVRAGKPVQAAAVTALLMVTLAGCQQANPFRSNSPHAGGPDPLLSRTNIPVASAASKQKANRQLVQARSLERQGKTDQAIQAYRNVMELDAQNAAAYHRLAVLHDQQSDFKTAAEMYNQALRRAPEDAELLCDVGYSYYLQRRWRESEIKLRKAIEADPHLARAHNNLGLLLARTDRADEALQQFAAAGCTPAEGHVNLAFALMLSDQRSEARQQVELALRQDASLKPAQKLLAALSEQDPPAAVSANAPPSKTDAKAVIAQVSQTDSAVVEPRQTEAAAVELPPTTAAPEEPPKTVAVPAEPLQTKAAPVEPLQTVAAPVELPPAEGVDAEPKPGTAAPVAADQTIFKRKAPLAVRRASLVREASPSNSTSAGIVQYVTPPADLKSASPSTSLRDETPPAQSQTIRRVPPPARDNPFRWHP